MENTTFEQRNLLESLLTLMSEEVAAVFENFPENKRQAILQLPQHQQGAWAKLHHDIIRLKKRKTDLEDALVYGNVKTEDLVAANATLEGMNKTLAGLNTQEDNLLFPSRAASTEQPNPFYDRNARPGILSIRSPYKGTLPDPVLRLQKN